jgi:cyclopropane-fatty-acyl-phospholipid synthase
VKSRIFTGSIAHHRYWPVNHDLSYPVYLYGFDIEDLPVLDRRYPLFGYNRSAVTSIHDRDYLEPGELPIKEKISALLQQHQIDGTLADVFMITSARYFNYVFNPVNFYYCYTGDHTLSAIIAEVNNTYGERHPYVLKPNTLNQGDWFATFQTPKVFHVSPFNKVEGIYHFYFSEPKDHVEIKIELVHENKKIMAAIFKGDAGPMTGANHVKTMLKYPVAPHLSVPRIYAHAFRLFFQKKLNFNDKPIPQSPLTLKKQNPGLVESICRRILFMALKKIKTGSLEIEMPNQEILHFGDPGNRQPAVMKILDYHFFPRIIFDGEIGFGESYMDKEWDTPDLVRLLKLMIENRDHLSDGNLMLSFLTRAKEKTAHDKRWNTIKNTPENIRLHYDLSNAFYARFLDQQMLYSCGIFEQKEDTLEIAQERKMARILARADIHETHHVLEIGCGWGGFAVFAAKQTGCRVTGITVSRAQYDRACQRVKDEGLEDRITIKLQDYRRTTGSFDRIVSIEMIEAVGPQFFSTYFRQGQNLLKPGGKMVFQAIIIEDNRYESYCRERDWIQKHIFPGGHLPSLQVLKETLSEHTDFKISDIYHMGVHYATTLAHWRERFLASKKEISRMGFDETFCRKWIYYFSICEAGFTVGGIDDIQMSLSL